MSASVSLRSTQSAASCTVEKTANGSVLIVQPGPPTGAPFPLTGEFLTVANAGQRIVLSPAVVAALLTVLQT
jgi:hypothetical protein